MKIGKARYGGDKKTYWKLKDGDSIYRIIPPIGDLADDGKWSIYYNIHYGYKNTKGNMRVFQSPLVKNRKTKMVEVPDKALERIEKLKAELIKAKETNNAELVERLMKLVGGQKAIYNMDSHHYVNAMDTQGNIGILKIRHNCKKALDLTIKKLRDGGVDPLSVDNGRFFVFSRSGMGRDTAFQVTVLEQKMNVPGVGEVKQEVVHKLTEDIIKRLDKEAGKLDELFARPTAEQVGRIVAEGAKAVDEILDTKETAEVSTDNEGPDAEEAETVSAVATPVSTPTQADPTVSITVVASTPTDTGPQISSTPAVTAPVTTPVALTAAPVPAQVAQTTAQAVNNQSDEDFLKTLNV